MPHPDHPADRRPDLAPGASVHAMLDAFYAEVAGDPLLAPYFAALDMRAHTARIASFWDTVAFDAGRFAGNVFEPHRRMPGLTPAHFTRWLATFERTVDARHDGEGAERAKAMAHRIAYTMQLRLGLSPAAPAPAPEPGRAALGRRPAGDAR